MNVSRDVYDIITAIKRSRPIDWVVDEPPPKRICLSPFSEDGAKAAKIPDTHHTTVNVN